MDWQRAIAAQAKGETPFSTAISLVRGLDVALEHDRSTRGSTSPTSGTCASAAAARAGVKAMGLELFSPDADSSAVVTAIRMPEDVDGQAIVASMRERSGVTVIGGQGRAARARSSASATSATWTSRTWPPALDALERALVEAGADVERGAAVPAALEAHAEPVAA